MIFVFIIAGCVLAAALIITLLVRLGYLVARRRPKRFWKRALVVNAALVPIHLFVLTPAVLAGFVEVRSCMTRGDERAYAGPRIAADGTWVMQSRDSLLAETKGTIPDAALAASAAKATVRFKTEDGVSLRGFLVQPRAGPPACTVVLVHGLFRGGFETEAPASMFRDLGAETLQVEMRDHGGSDHTTFTFGFRERLDVLAAVEFLRKDPARKGRPLVLYAVSLGTAAVMRAAPDITPLAGLVLDAPMDDLSETAHRMLSEAPRESHRAPGMWQPFRSLSITAMEIWCGFRFDEVRPIDDLARLPADLPALLIGGGEDLRMPPASVQAMADRIPSKPGLKSVWIRPGSYHGQVWNDDPAGYREHLAAFMKLVVRP